MVSYTGGSQQKKSGEIHIPDENELYMKLRKTYTVDKKYLAGFDDQIAQDGEIN